MLTHMLKDAVLGDRLAATFSLHDDKQLDVAMTSMRHITMKTCDLISGWKDWWSLSGSNR